MRGRSPFPLGRGYFGQGVAYDAGNATKLSSSKQGSLYHPSKGQKRGKSGLNPIEENRESYGNETSGR